MTPELLARLTRISEEISVSKSREKQVKTQLSKEKRAKLYGESGVRIIQTENGKLSAYAPVGMTSVKFVKVLDTCAEKIQNFKNNQDGTVLSL